MNDWINSLFVAVGAFVCWYNVIVILRDKQVRGVAWWSTAFFASRSWWNIYYYPSLEQWASFSMCIALALANTTWVILAIKYTRRKR